MKNYSEISFLILSLSLLKGVGPVFVKKNLSLLRQDTDRSDRSQSRKNTFENLRNLFAQIGKKYSSADIHNAISKAEGIIAECESSQIGFTSLLDKNYPQKLLELKDSPPVIFFIGNSSLLNRSTVTIIGTRKPNRNGQIIAERIGKHFALRGWSICNGLADGVDTSAIQDTEDSCFENIIGVVGSGLAQTSFRSLSKQSVFNIERILKCNGLVISEIPPSKNQNTFSVIKSCRLQAGLGSGLILIQSSIEGGSRFTVKAAVDSNKPLGIVRPLKADIHHNNYSANRKIIEEGVQGLSNFLSLEKSKKSVSRIVILSGKESYPEFEETLKSVNASPF